MKMILMHDKAGKKDWVIPQNTSDWRFFDEDTQMLK